MSSNHCDVIVVGAGPAGATAAFVLAAQGLRVDLIDRRRFPREKLCGGLLTWKTLEVIESVFHLGAQELQSQGLILCARRSYIVADPSGRSIARTLDFPFHFVARGAYDHFWLQQAIRAGAVFSPGARVLAVDPRNAEVLTADGETRRADFVVGADGVDSRVRRSLERRRCIPAGRGAGTALALEAFVPLEALAGPPGAPAIFYGHVPWGYAWSFPGDGHRVLGIAGMGVRSGRRLREALKALIASLTRPRAFDPAIAAHRLPYGNFLSRPGHGRVLLAGDAAGFADPFLGEGIYYAHRSGALAAEAILEAAGRGRDAAEGYAQRLRRSILPEMRYARAGRNLIFSLPPRLYYPTLAAALRLMPKTCEETVQGLRTFRWLRRKKPLSARAAPPKRPRAR